jgi:translation elongation factor EF-1beta
MTENVDTQLKQMSEDLKEIIEHLNETNRTQDTSDPVSYGMNNFHWVIFCHTCSWISVIPPIMKMWNVASTNMEDIMIKSLLHSFLPPYTSMQAVVHSFPSFSAGSPCILLIFMPVRTYLYMYIQGFLISSIFYILLLSDCCLCPGSILYHSDLILHRSFIPTDVICPWIRLYSI